MLDLTLAHSPTSSILASVEEGSRRSPPLESKQNLELFYRSHYPPRIYVLFLVFSTNLIWKVNRMQKNIG